jgi:hypothetical protein
MPVSCNNIHPNNARIIPLRHCLKPDDVIPDVETGNALAIDIMSIVSIYPWVTMMALRYCTGLEYLGPGYRRIIQQRRFTNQIKDDEIKPQAEKSW